MPKIIVLIILFSITVQSDLFANEEKVVFRGIPIIQCNSSFEKSRNHQLNESQQLESRVLITKVGNKYIWASRKNIELSMHKNGEITTYLETNGAGYVRVFEHDGIALYTEHMPIALESVTFWGQSEK